MKENLAEKYLDHIKATASKNTYKEYRHGIEKFAKWYNKTPDEILDERRQDWTSGDLHQKKRFKREIEKFHAWLLQPIHSIRRRGKLEPNQAYSINSARTMCLGIQQLFRFYEMPIILDIGSPVSRTVISTKDFVPTPQQYKEMYRVADNLRDKLIISMGKDLAWRIGDFAQIRKDGIESPQLPNLNQDAPIPFDLITEKEDVLAKSFLSQETVDLLKEYLPTLRNDNPYLFQSNTEGHFDEESINRVLRTLAEKAKIIIPRNKRLRFHAFRKRFLSTCANLHIDINTAKVLVGKSVEKDMLTYLSEVEHKKAFLTIHNVLRLTEMPITRTTPKDVSDLEKRVDDLERLVHGVIALGGRELVDKAKRALDLMDIGLLRKQQLEQSLIETLKEIGEEEEKRLKEEYRKLIEAPNNNNQE